MIFFYLLRAAEQKSRLACLYHAEVVIAVAGGDRVKADGLQSFYRRKLRLFDSQAVAGYLAVLRRLERVAEDRRSAELFHERIGKLRERVRQDDDLRQLAQLVEKFARAGHRIDLLYRRLYLVKTEFMLFQYRYAVFHQFIVIGLVPRGPAQLRDAARAGKLYPYLGDENAFKIQTNYIHL